MNFSSVLGFTTRNVSLLSRLTVLHDDSGFPFSGPAVGGFGGVAAVFMTHWFMREPEFLWTGTGEPAGAVPLADWRRVLEVPLEEKRLAVIKRAYRRKAQVAHPDRGGDTAAMTQLNEAYRLALEELGGN